jgi:tetratricopeptide (TPR) repeat protein
MAGRESHRDSLTKFWPHLQALLDAGRWSDAIVTVRALMERTGWLELNVTLGALLFERQHYGDAIAVWTAVIERASEQGRRDLLAAIYSNLAATYRELGDGVLARRFQQQALRFQDDFGADDLLHLANDAIAAEHYDLAESLLDSMSDLLDNHPHWLAEIYATRGIIALRCGHPRVARRGLLTAYRAHRQIGDDAGAARDLLNAAEAFQMMHRLLAAQRCLAQASRHFAEAQQPAWQAETERRAERLRRVMALAKWDASRN